MKYLDVLISGYLKEGVITASLSDALGYLDYVGLRHFGAVTAGLLRIDYKDC